MPKRKTEFFWSGCIKDAISYARDLKGVHDRTETETEEVEVATTSTETEKRKVPKTTFEMLGLAVGTMIYFRNEESTVAETVDLENKVKYGGKIYSLSTLALKLYQEEVNKNQKTLNGYLYFYYNGKRLFDLRPDQQDKE